MINVIYRFTLKEGMEALYTERWHRLVTYLKNNSGALGSRLHRSVDNPLQMIAYSQWPSVEVYKRSWGKDVVFPPEIASLREEMKAYVESSQDPEIMELRADRLIEKEVVRPDKKRVLIYTDFEHKATGKNSVAQSLLCLNTYLDPSQYEVMLRDPDYFKNGSWATEDTAAVIMPGGRTAPHYDETGLGKKGAQILRDYVETGGRYLGLCAGGYFGASVTDFDKGGDLAIYLEGPLNFLKGEAIGPIHGPNTYTYEENNPEKCSEIVPFTYEGMTYHAYYNGGCYFKPTDLSNVKVLAQYQDVAGNPPAIIECAVGRGKAILSGVHFECSPDAQDLRPDPSMSAETEIKKAELRAKLLAYQALREKLVVNMLANLGLKINPKYQHLLNHAPAGGAGARSPSPLKDVFAARSAALTAAPAPE